MASGLHPMHDGGRKYGPITDVVLGRNGGFKSVTYGDKKFVGHVSTATTSQRRQPRSVRPSP